MSDVSSNPKGWCCTSLDKVAAWGSGGTPSRNVERYFQGSIPWVKTGELETKYIRETEEHISEEALNNSSAKIFPRGSVGIAMYGATIGKLSIWGIDASTNQACAVGIPSEAINNEFLYYYIFSERQNLIKAGKGGAQPNLSQSIIKEWPISLPPLPEQHRIVAKIEELFSELDKGIENLKTAQAQLKVYRQALLKHAIEGKLTAQWRAENQDKLETAAALQQRIQQERAQRYQQQLADWQTNGGSKPKIPKSLPSLTAKELAELPELPEGWGWVRVGEIADVQLGRQRSPNNRSNLFPTKYIRAGNLTDNGLDLKDVLDMEFEPQERARFLLKAGDVLLSEASGSANQVGKPAVWRGEIEECCFQNTVIRVRSLDELSEYLFWVFKTYYVTGVFSKLSGGVGINHLSAGKFESMAIPIVAISESEKILELINEKLSLIENLELTITTSLQQAEALRQTILKKAFSGQLVPQDPHDEPASELLARIRAELDKTPKLKNKGKLA